MVRRIGFPPIVKSNAKILILGSMPGIKSLQENQYYAHPRNAFWPIMCKLLNSADDIDYKKKKQLILNNKIALWDVLKGCHREGSLDSNIDHSTSEANDFESFLKKNNKIESIFFNGAEAEKLFKKFVIKNITNKQLEYFKLPSTSPAHAAMSFENKLFNWEVIKTNL